MGIVKHEMLPLRFIAAIGRDLEWLRLSVAYEEIPVKGEGCIYEILKLLKWHVSEYIGNKEITEEIGSWMGRLKRYKPNRKLKKADSQELMEDIRSWTDILSENLTKIFVIKLYTEGSLNYNCLINEGVEKFFCKKKYWNRLSKTSREDLENAGYCLACSIPTASAMCALRAIEDVFRLYYKKRARKAVGSKTWNQCLRELETNKRANKELIGQLDFIRKYKRNAAAHPGKIFTQKESEKIFLAVIESIEMMFKDLKY